MENYFTEIGEYQIAREEILYIKLEPTDDINLVNVEIHFKHTYEVLTLKKIFKANISL